VTVRARPTRVLPYLLAFVLGAGGAVLTACGSSNPAMIPQQNSNRLKSDLDEVLSAVQASNCARAARALAQLEADYASLPEGTSKRLKRRLREGLDRLEDQARRECEATETQTTETQTTETETTQTETIPTTTTDTTATVPTVPTTETTTDSVPTTPTTPDSIPTTTTDETGGTGTP
jgi:hypothetical protein